MRASIYKREDGTVFIAQEHVHHSCGRIFAVCATAEDADEIVAALEKRVVNPFVTCLRKIADERVTGLKRDANQGDKVICHASAIWGDVVRCFADHAPDQLPLREK